MLNLIQTEFLKLRRNKLIWLMLLTAIIMPFFALFFVHKGVDPRKYYRWSALSFTLIIILPFILGILSTMLMHQENQYDTLKQLWIVPISKMGYFFSKFFVVLVYSICFMLITFVASVMVSVLSGYLVFEWENVFYLLKKCLAAGFFTAFAMLPILAIASSQKGYILPVCITLVYVFLNFFIMPINMYLHPLSSMGVIVDIPGMVWKQGINVPLAFVCICVWDIISVFFANIALKRSEV
ncbi:ABC transporter permease (plasmid) [Paraclostridium ghonii]|uniref:ABC transporter permease n=1 Tax=Paraclostridium ghonii TaxID=29358 RepID=UPI00202CC800|nr:ABC transporter permease [Paeniclostridium ghonii]MCM0167573.1 ABC transporter permease [Paeniclostridium ghonii]